MIYMKTEIRKIVTRSALFFGILAVRAAGMKLAAWHQLNRNSKMQGGVNRLPRCFYLRYIRTCMIAPRVAFRRNSCYNRT